MQKKLAGMLSIIFTIVLCCGNYVLADSTYDIFTYTVSSQKVTITGCNSSASGTIEIPDVINGQTVTTIGEAAFQNRPNITEVIIPSTIEILPRNAFLNCTGLKNVKLPGTLNTISTSAFQGCTALETINTENVNIFGEESFLNCSSLKSVNLSNATYVRKNAFRGCSSLETVTAFKKLLSLAQGAFNSCSALESVSLPASVRSIEEGVFSNCTSLQNIFVDDACTYVQDIDGVLCMGNVLYFFPTGRKGEVAIPDGIEIIGAKAFGTSTADSVYIPESVKTFRNRVFYMSSLESVVFPRTVETLGIELFGLCSNLKQICAPSKFAKTEADWNNSALNATFYDYIVTYTKDGEVFTKEYVLEGKNAEYPEIFSDSFNFYDENYNEWTGENITSDATIIMEEITPLSDNTNIKVEYFLNDNYIEITDWIDDGDTAYNTTTIPADADYPLLTITPEDDNAQVDTTENNNGTEITYEIKVTAENGTTKFYSISFIREEKKYNEIVDVPHLGDIMIDFGSADWQSLLPSEAEAKLSDGSSVFLPVEWNTDEVDVYMPSTYPISGALILDEESDIVNPSGFMAEINVTIFDPIPEDRFIMMVLPLEELSIDEGIDIDRVLPESVTVDISDGSSIELPVIWDTTTFDYNITNTIQTIYGELILDEYPGITNPDGIRAEMSVWIYIPVTDKEIVGVHNSDEEEPLYIPYGANLDSVDFPKTIAVDLDDGTTIDLEVIWDLSQLNTTNPGPVNISGELVLIDGISNSENFAALLKAEVMEKKQADLSLAWLKYNLNNCEYEITEADKTAENEWTMYIPENEFTATMSLMVSAEVTDPANANIFINQPVQMTDSGLKATITVSAVDGEESAVYTVYFKSKAVTWNVQFLANGQVISEQIIKDGYPAHNPGPVEDTDMEFAGWDKDFTSVTSDMTINAIFKEINDNEWSFMYLEKIDDIVIDSTMSIETLRAILPDTAWAWFRKGAETKCIPLEIEWIIPENFFELGADVKLLVARIVTSPVGTLTVDANVYAEIGVSFAGSGDATARYIISVSNLNDVSVPYDASESQVRAALPSTVAVTFDNGTTENLNVSWDLSEITTTFPGSYEVIGGILHGSSILNPGEHKAKINVIVKEKPDATGALRAEAITTTPGEEITITIKADENLNMAVGRFMIKFDREMLELVDYEIGDLISESSWVVNEAYNNNGETCMLVSFMNLSNITAGGDVITLKLKVNDNAPGDTHYPISLENLDFYDFDENSVAVDKIDGDVHVIRYTLGDVNNNGNIELLDAFRVLQYDVGFRTFTIAEKYAADVNNDATVNIADALLIQEFDAGLITEF